MNRDSLNRTATEVVPERPESILESRFSELGHAVTDLDQTVGDTISRFSPVIVPYPVAMETDPSKQPPKAVQSEVVDRLEKLTNHVRSLTDRLRTALANAQI